MKLHFNIYFVLLLMCLAQDVQSQKESSIWYFGDKAGLNFNTNPPSILVNSAMNSIEGCSSIADPLGNLQFYTNGETIWNKLHLVMDNGSGLKGNASSVQGALIVKQPGNSNIYFVFTLDDTYGPDGFCYSKVDMNLSSGNGSVTTKNTLLFTPCTEKMAAVKHCNGIDTWVMVHDTTNLFMAFLVTSNGVSPAPVVSATGLYNGKAGYQGSIKFSSNGKKLASASVGVDSLPGLRPGAFELFDFDKSSGLLSNALILAKGLNTYKYAYGLEFSADCSKLYGTKANTPSQNRIFQWNLCAGTNSAIVSSIYTVASPTIGPWGLQLGPDKKIYIARSFSSNLNVIQNPDNSGPACNYSEGSQSISPMTSLLGLPAFVSAPFRSSTYTFTSNCLNAVFTAFADESTFCGVPTATANGFSWSFGDPGSGTANTSTLSTPTHSFSTAGSHTVQLVIHYFCGGDDTIKKVVTVTPCTGIYSHNNSSLNLKVYPNPSQGQFEIELEKEARIIIRDVIGRLIFEEEFQSGKHKIDLVNENAGLYFLSCHKNYGANSIPVLIDK